MTEEDIDNRLEYDPLYYVKLGALVPCCPHCGSKAIVVLHADHSNGVRIHMSCCHCGDPFLVTDEQEYVEEDADEIPH